MLLLETKVDAERRLARYESIRRELQEEDENAEDRPYWLLTISAGEHTARAAIAWADEALAALQDLVLPSAARPRAMNPRSQVI
jgi:hypothetical protein